MTKKPRNHDEYLAALPADQRRALEKVRVILRKALPDAEECISYQLPAFRDKRILFAYAARANHCALYPMSGTVVEAFAEELAGFDTSKGTIRFQPDHPVPATLIRKLVRARLAEVAELRKKPS